MQGLLFIAVACILWVAFLPCSIWGLFYTKGVIIIDRDKFLVPSIRRKNFLEIYDTEIAHVLITYNRNTGEAVKAKSRMKSGKVRVIPSNPFKDDEDFAQWITMINDRIGNETKMLGKWASDFYSKVQ